MKSDIEDNGMNISTTTMSSYASNIPSNCDVITDDVVFHLPYGRNYVCRWLSPKESKTKRTKEEKNTFTFLFLWIDNGFKCKYLIRIRNCITSCHKLNIFISFYFAIWFGSYSIPSALIFAFFHSFCIHLAIRIVK